MKRLSLAIGSLLILSTPALAAAGDQAAPAPKDGMATVAPVPPGSDKGRWHPMPPPGPRPGTGDWALRLAERLAGAETLVGIKSDQLDAWRDYTSALIDLFSPPAPRAHPGEGPGEARLDNALDRQEQIARRMKERGVKADALLQAITALRAKLTPQQIDRLATIELFPRPPMRGPHAWDRGPMGQGPMGQGPMGHGPMGDGMMGKGPMNRDAWNPAPGPGPGSHGPDMAGPADHEPADHGPMMMGPPDEGGPDQDAMDGGPGPMNGEAPIGTEPNTTPPGPDAAPPAPQQ